MHISRIQSCGCRRPGVAFWVHGLGFRFRVQGLGFRAHSIVGVLDQNLCWPGWHGVYQDRAREHEQGIRPSHCKTADMEVTTTLTMVPAKKQIMTTMQTMVPMVLFALVLSTVVLLCCCCCCCCCCGWWFRELNIKMHVFASLAILAAECRAIQGPATPSSPSSCCLTRPPRFNLFHL